MGKRRTVVVISTSSSSSSEENDGGRGSSGSRSRSASISRRKPRKGMTKRGRVSNEESMKVKVEFDILSEDFSECLNDFNLMSGLTTYDRKELWVDKHKPRSLADLAVHKKKVEEVKKWLDERVKISKVSGRHSMCCITCQPCREKNSGERESVPVVELHSHPYQAPPSSSSVDLAL